MISLENMINDLVDDGIVSHIAVRVGRGKDVLCEAFRGESTKKLFLI